MKCKRNKGNALVIVLILITIILTISLGTGYMTIAEIRMQTSIEDASVAYAAAEAGIEDGLLRWRYNRDVETSDVDAAGKLVPYHHRVNISSGKVEKVTDISVLPLLSDASYYDLNISYHKDGRQNIPLEPNDKLELLGFKNNNAVKLYFAFSNYTDIVGQDRYVVTLRTQHLAGGVETQIYSTDLCEDPSTNLPGQFCMIPVLEDPNDKDKDLVESNSVMLGQGDTITFNSWSNKNLKLQIWAEDSSQASFPLDQAQTTIESTGYYGDSKRKLEATIDRKTGVLLGIYDLMMYSGGTIENGP